MHGSIKRRQKRYIKLSLEPARLPTQEAAGVQRGSAPLPSHHVLPAMDIECQLNHNLLFDWQGEWAFFFGQPN